jgi:ABC-type multidrug transport system ATPase subunit
MKEPLLKIQAVKKHFGAKEALKDLSLDLYKGEVMALLGVNGAGKSTLSAILAGLHPPTGGDVLYGGVSIYRDLVSYRKEIGFCPQKPNLDASLTLRENLSFAGRYHRMDRKKVKESVDLLMNKFSLHEYAEEKASILSGGYRQRFLLARSLIHAPKFIILDEPTIGLDPKVRQELWKQVKALKEEGVTVLITTHYLDEAEQVADRVCIIDKGVLKTVDTPKNLIAAHGTKTLEEVFLTLTKEGSL